MSTVLTLLLIPAVARANPIQAVNRARFAYCGLSRRSHPPLTASRKLNEIARLVARGESLDAAERSVGYPAARAVWIRITGRLDGASVERMVKRHFCRQLADPQLRRIGTYRRNATELWIVVAQPFVTPVEQKAAKLSLHMLRLINHARSHARTCGRRYFPAATPLSLSSALTRAAYAHSKDMANHDFFSHIGSDGSTPGERAVRSGYRWRDVGENIASGISVPQRVVSAWLSSPPHCTNIMTAAFRQVGVAFAVNNRSRYVIYWTADFGTRR